MNIRLARDVAKLFLRSLRKRYGTYATLTLPPLKEEQQDWITTPDWIISEQEREDDQLLKPPSYRRSYNRQMLPIFYEDISYIPNVTVDVPDKLIFERPDTRIGYAPQISIGPWRNQTKARSFYGLIPKLYLQILRSPYIHVEANRPRYDQKYESASKYNQLLSFINRTYGTTEEYIEAVDVIRNNWPNLEKIANALAINEAIDYQYGMRGKLLKDSIYHSGYWNLPFGIDAIMPRQ